MSEKGILSPKGFSASAVRCGIKESAAGKSAVSTKNDLAIIVSDISCSSAALFTSNKIRAAPILVSSENLKKSSFKTRAIIVNSGNANACTGKQGIEDAKEMCRLVANNLKIEETEVLVASTGVIGRKMPMEKLRNGIAVACSSISSSSEIANEIARAIMTTDTFPKQFVKEISIDGKKVTLAGIAKGAGMIAPNLATMLCFITTDAKITSNALQSSLKESVSKSFNSISVDGDMSTNDTIFILANGIAGNAEITKANSSVFQEALDFICLELAKSIVKDGEGATKLIEVVVKGAKSEKEAKAAAMTVVNSPLVKTAIYGRDPNWGRIAAALGRSGAVLEEEKLKISLIGIEIFNGAPTGREDECKKEMEKKEIKIIADLQIGNFSATAYGCDLTEKYIEINAEYTT